MNMPHDPEGIVARYLDEELAREERARLDEHVIGCEACWAEVELAREGRALAESLRAVAPPQVRERVRALAAGERAEQGPGSGQDAAGARLGGTGVRLRALITLAAGVAVVGIGVAGLQLTSAGSDPDPVAAAAAVFDDDPAVGSGGIAPPVRRIGELRWEGTREQQLGAQSAVIHRFGDGGGHRVLLVSSEHQFPRVGNARTVGPGTSWVADVDGAAVYCTDHGGKSWLVVGSSTDEALDAGRAAGLA